MDTKSAHVAVRATEQEQGTRSTGELLRSWSLHGENALANTVVFGLCHHASAIVVVHKHASGTS